MHMYQKHILDRLRQAETLRYRELQPDGVESSHFKYHLNQLIRDNLVVQVGRGVYALSGQGKTAVDRLSDGRINPRLTPKVITYTLLHDDNSYYLYRKTKEPYRNLLNMIGGKLHLGENATDAAVREVHEKTDEHIDPPQLEAIAEIRIRHEGRLLSHVTAYVFSAQYQGGLLSLEKIAIDDVRSHDDLAPDLLPLLDVIGSGSLQHVDLDITL